MKKLLELKSISAGYGAKTVLNDVNLAVFENDFIGIIGPNGGGKTTLIKVILRLIDPFKGSISFYDSALQGNKKAIGYLPQFKIIDRLFPITVKDTIYSGLMREKKLFRNFSKAEKEKGNALIDRFGLSHLVNRTVGELSGGQMQRVFLCRALVSSPQILILDEPDTFVDMSFAETLYEILRELNKSMAILLVSHNVGPLITSLTSVACINETLHYHTSEEFSHELFENAGCPLHIVEHGEIPHTILRKHEVKT